MASNDFDIAIVGLACRVPGACDLEAFWRNLEEGVESITRFSDEELSAAGVPTSHLEDPLYVKAAPILDHPDAFDASFFGFTPVAARAMDPQHRILLELACEALEHAGHDAERSDARVGVFAGSALNSYLAATGLHRRLAQSYIPTLIGNDKDFLSTRISYKLDLRGPSITVQTACSTSLVAVHLARQSLLSHECDMALAGAISVRVPHQTGYFHDGGGVVSPDGHVRAFDAKANGTVFGSGGGMLVLKRMADALADGDTIHGVVKGSAVNNDGSAKAGYTAPSVDSQADAVVEALANAGVDAESISYVEAHGSGTLVGDPIEIRALTKAFRASTRRVGYCAIGSVKTNLGHLDAAAGVAGLIKTILALEHRKIPPSLNFSEPNPEIDFSATPFYVNTELRDWTSDGPRRAGVMATGMGGTNAHVILEEAPEPAPTTCEKPPYLLVSSAKTEAALDRATVNLRERLKSDETLDMADVCYTLQVGRKGYPHRRILVCDSRDAAVAGLDVKDSKHAASSHVDQTTRRPLVFLLPGIGEHYVGMGSDLYERRGVFQEEVDHCAEILRPHLGVDIREVIYPKSGSWRRTEGPEGIDLKRMLGLETDGGEAAEDQRLGETIYAQPALFTIEYALARLWMDLGAVPDAIVGHSMGEYVAACLAGVFSLEDALRLIARRAQLVDPLPQGAMLAIPLSEEEILPLLGPDLSISLINGPNLCVVAGPVAAMADFEEILKARDVNYRPIKNSHAFHSRMLDPIVPELEAEFGHTRLEAPKIPYISNVTGGWITDAAATDPESWARHTNHTSRFSDALRALWQLENPLLLEVGPGKTLGALAMQHPERATANDPVVVSSLRAHYENASDLEVVLQGVGRLWLSGVEIEWPRLHKHERRRLVPLPSYPFERKRYWEDAAGSEIGRDEVPSRTEVTMTPRAPETATTRGSRRERIAARLRTLIEELSGIEVASDSTSFTEMGFESLFLTQASQLFQTKFGVKISFRQMLDELSTVAKLAAYIDEQLPPDQYPQDPVSAPPPAREPAGSPNRPQAPAGSPLELLVAQNAQLMQLLLDQHRGEESGAAPSADAPTTDGLRIVHQPALSNGATRPETPAHARDRFGPYKPLDKGKGGQLSARQQAALDQLTARYVEKTASSKRYAADHRSHFADPRAVAGFKSHWKEMVYPIVSERSKGSKIWDIDGNEYVDITMGFGIYLFGHSPDWLIDALQDQLRSDIAIGPQSALAGEVADLICEFTGLDRVTFCNTGSEGVMAAIRLARLATGRQRVVTFTGDYHGMFEEVLVRGTWDNGVYRAQPLAPGIPANLVENMLVLDYGAPESLDIIRNHASEIAAVLVEPVRSRQPGFQPREFMQALRTVTEETGAALIFDEMVTGFRCHPGGAQAYFGVQADLATYGKVLGAGIPIGVLAGKRKYMDGLDGGAWNYGDDSFPEVGVTFFAGTFVRHPLAMAAAWQVLHRLKEQGPNLQLALAERVARFCRTLNEYLEKVGVPIRLSHFSAFAMIEHAADLEFISLLWYYLREKGIHAWEGRTWYFTLAHTDEDFDRMIRAFKESVAEMQAGGFLPGSPETPPSPGPLPEAEPEYPRRDTSPVTEGQREILLASAMDPGASCAFNQSFNVEFSGPLDVAALEESIRQLFERHPALRSSFSPDLETQIFHPNRFEKLTVVDVSDVEGAEQDKRFDEFVDREAATPFDLHRGPTTRLTLFKFSARSHRLVVTAHHVVCDGWSIALVVFDLSRIYNATVAGRIPLLPPPSAFGDFARARQRENTGAEYEATEQFWLNQYADSYADLDLPADRARPTVRTFAGTTVSRVMDPELFARLKKTTSELGGTLFATLFAAYAAFLHRLTSREDIVVGVPAAGQAIFDCSELVGHCVNFLPIRVRFSGTTTFAAFAREVKTAVLNAFDHQKFTYGTLVRKLGALDRSGERPPLVSALFNIDKSGFDTYGFDGLDFAVSYNAKRYVNFDLFFNLVQTETGLELKCEYNSDIFDHATIVRWLAQFEVLVEAAIADASVQVGELPLMSRDEEQRLLVGWSPTASADPRDQTLHAMFADQAGRTPERVALEGEESVLSYAELERQANRIAHVLRARGIGRGQRVGVCLERGSGLVATVLGILQSGAAYVPLDPAFPEARLQFMAEDAELALVLSTGDLADLTGVPRERQLLLDEDSAALEGAPATPLPVDEAAARPEDPAYLIYTSGSTGQPKGVVVPHRAVVNLLRSMAREPGLTPDDILVAVTTLSFDIAVLELFLPLTLGATVVMAGRDAVGDGAALGTLLEGHEATVMQATPATWRLLLDAGWAGRPDFKALVGGEPLPRDLAEALLDRGVEVWNMYGPTETTVWSTCARITDPARIVIGRPIANTVARVLDAHGQLCPIGVPGELYIGGAGVALGYWRRPELTKTRFVHDPRESGEILYRTGDLARWESDGVLQHLGRLDDQVKVNGFRIELGEVEAALAAHPEVQQAVAAVLRDEGGGARLVAYVVPRDGQPVIGSELRRHARMQLPDYMVPSIISEIAQIPLTPNGKIHRSALPDPLHAVTSRRVEKPSGEMELAMAQVWESLLGVTGVTRQDNFFELGGHSLLAVRAAALFEERVGVRISPRSLFFETLKQVAASAQSEVQSGPKSAASA